MEARTARCECELLAVEALSAVVREKEADVVEVVAFLDLLLVDFLELAGLAIIGAEDLLQGASRDILLADTADLRAAGVLVLLDAIDGREPDRRGHTVGRSPVWFLNVAPTSELGLAEEARHREGTAMDNTCDEHHVEQRPHRFDTVLFSRPRATLLDELPKFRVRGLQLRRLRLQGRIRGDGARSAEVNVFPIFAEEAGALEFLAGALEPVVVERARRGATTPGLDVRLYDRLGCVGAAEAVGARKKPVSVERDELRRHLGVLFVDVGVIVHGPIVEPARKHIVEDVYGAVLGLGDVEEVVERRAREVLQRRGAATVRLVLRRVLDLHAVLEYVVTIDGEATLGLDRELEINLRPCAAHLPHNLYVVRRIGAHRVVVDELEAAPGPGREGRGEERVALEAHAKLGGEVVAPEELVLLRHVAQASNILRHGLLDRVQARKVRLGLAHRVRG
eukprot:scaffold78330_cov60-Phaeocystis_antarctica.AAC.2